MEWQTIGQFEIYIVFSQSSWQCYCYYCYSNNIVSALTLAPWVVWQQINTVSNVNCLLKVALDAKQVVSLVPKFKINLKPSMFNYLFIYSLIVIIHFNLDSIMPVTLCIITLLSIVINWTQVCQQGILEGKFHCIIDLLFDWFGLVCFANKRKNCQLPYS